MQSSPHPLCKLLCFSWIRFVMVIDEEKISRPRRKGITSFLRSNWGRDNSHTLSIRAFSKNVMTFLAVETVWRDICQSNSPIFVKTSVRAPAGPQFALGL